MSQHYLLKTEPSEYSFGDLQRDKTTVWDGVSNPAALKNLREMKPGARRRKLGRRIARRGGPEVCYRSSGLARLDLARAGIGKEGAWAMILGMTTLTFVHVVLSLIGILSGFVVVYGLLTSKPLDGWTAVFLASTVATSVTGFFFPFHGITPGGVIGIISLAALAVAIFARYGRNLAGGWRRTYVITAIIALYLNVFIFIVQSFEKSQTLRALAPTQSEPPFKVTQVVVLALFVVLTIAAAKKFREEPVRTA